MLKWNATKEEMKVIAKIVERYAVLAGDHSVRNLFMDIEACHSNGNPLDFEGLLNASAGEFLHDVGGIVNHLNRKTGALEDCFVPRYSRSNG